MIKKITPKTFKLSLPFPGRGNHVITIGLPQNINRNECLVPHVHPIPYSKYIQYEDLPDASGWENDDLVQKTCGPNRCKDGPDLDVSKAIEEAIEAKSTELGYYETYDKHPFLQEMVLCSLHKVSIFGRNKPLNPECKRRIIWYQDKLWKSSVQIFGKCSFDRDFLKCHDKIAKYLRRYAEPFEVPDKKAVSYQGNQADSEQRMGCHPKQCQVMYLPNC